MKIDHEYLKGLLEPFEASDTPTTDINELGRAGFSHQEDKFIFHLSIPADRNLVQGEQGDDLGYRRGVDGYVSWGGCSFTSNCIWSRIS